MLKLLLVLVGACLVTGDDQGALEALSDNNYRLPIELQNLLQNLAQKTDVFYDPHEEIPAMTGLLDSIEERLRIQRKELLQKSDLAKLALDPATRVKVADSQTSLDKSKTRLAFLKAQTTAMNNTVTVKRNRVERLEGEMRALQMYSEEVKDLINARGESQEDHSEKRVETALSILGDEEGLVRTMMAFLQGKNKGKKITFNMLAKAAGDARGTMEGAQAADAGVRR